MQDLSLVCDTHYPVALLTYSNLLNSNTVNLVAIGASSMKLAFLTAVGPNGIMISPVCIFSGKVHFMMMVITSRVRLLHRLHWKCNRSCVRS